MTTAKHTPNEVHAFIMRIAFCRGIERTETHSIYAGVRASILNDCDWLEWVDVASGLSEEGKAELIDWVKFV